MRDGYWSRLRKVPSTLTFHPAFLERLDPSWRVADLGCGEGLTMAALAQRGQGRLVGVDVGGPGLATASAKGVAGACFVRGDLRRLPLADGSCQAAMFHAVLTTLPTPADRLAVLAEARRVATRLVYLADFLLTPEDPYYLARYEQGLAETGEWGTFIVREGERRLYTAHHYTESELRDCMAAVGLRPVLFEPGRFTTRSGKVINGVWMMAE